MHKLAALLNKLQDQNLVTTVAAYSPEKTAGRMTPLGYSVKEGFHMQTMLIIFSLFFIFHCSVYKKVCSYILSEVPKQRNIVPLPFYNHVHALLSAVCEANKLEEDP